MSVKKIIASEDEQLKLNGEGATSTEAVDSLVDIGDFKDPSVRDRFLRQTLVTVLRAAYQKFSLTTFDGRFNPCYGLAPTIEWANRVFESDRTRWDGAESVFLAARYSAAKAYSVVLHMGAATGVLSELPGVDLFIAKFDQPITINTQGSSGRSVLFSDFGKVNLFYKILGDYIGRYPSVFDLKTKEALDNSNLNLSVLSDSIVLGVPLVSLANLLSKDS